MSAVAGIIRNSQVVLPDGYLDRFEGRNVLVTILDVDFPQQVPSSAVHNFEEIADSFDNYVGGWTSFNDEMPVDDVVRGLRKGRNFDF